jgi:hypothetical protein
MNIFDFFLDSVIVCSIIYSDFVRRVTMNAQLNLFFKALGIRIHHNGAFLIKSCRGLYIKGNGDYQWLPH